MFTQNMPSIFDEVGVIDQTQRIRLKNINNDLIYSLGGINGVEFCFCKAFIFGIIGATS
ncbi:hypothetical protein GCM10007938_11210 [Vibrio zhanjiangensis]|uniref:Uncharacterized protein n=1 Tax=Vibrio zhanjiangensis TaxID=1046128 RepID=A0ABQ6EWZ4_9VIBR|nr:hypothetical protein GCM10007938_11210 [Vibrio zhanjiangensis]